MMFGLRDRSPMKVGEPVIPFANDGHFAGSVLRETRKEVLDGLRGSPQPKWDILCRVGRGV